MKNLYPKGKGKIHPSPAVPSSPPNHDVLAVLKLLPAAIVVLTAAMKYEDKEVLAYLITRSMHGPSAPRMATGGERRRLRGPVAAHRPLFDCGCFDCYTSFWSRWDCSPNRELIHQAIEAYEEHLASSEKKGGRGRRKERRALDKSEKCKEKTKAEEPQKAAGPESLVVEEANKLRGEPTAADEAASVSGEVADASAIGDGTGEEALDERNGQEEAEPTGGERRRGWPDLMELINSRFWNLWGPSE
ncbi:hypothetical protein Cni_G20185 [Canna indica]|uniref:Uncharacterized protein n=1 Tax=Canna indica TaxID=4628 RepID=A0AAQ3KQV9_9LILI|nr:hypothetical protein Cni_G20185 [Canna indica]